MKKGIVMDIDNAFLTLLTPEGEFLRARKQNQPYAIGDEIHFFPVENHKTFHSFIPFINIFKVKPVWAVSVLAVLIILLGSFIPMYQNDKAYAYMSIDGDPSIELGVNKKMQVVEITGFNKEGKNVISQISDWKKKDVSQLTKTILTEMKNEGYLKNKGLIIISTVRTNQPEAKAEEKLKENINEIKQTISKQQLELNVFNGTEKDRETAHEQGLTTGKYQENKIQSSINQKSKEKSYQNPIDKNQDKNNSSYQPADSTLPPGQLKKQEESSPAQNKTESNGNVNRLGVNPVPRESWKKQEEHVKENNGQLKKNEYQKDKTDHNQWSNQNHNSNPNAQNNKGHKDK